jgi:hypothetical protein
MYPWERLRNDGGIARRLTGREECRGKEEKHQQSAAGVAQREPTRRAGNRVDSVCDQRSHERPYEWMHEGKVLVRRAEHGNGRGMGSEGRREAAERPGASELPEGCSGRLVFPSERSGEPERGA